MDYYVDEDPEQKIVTKAQHIDHFKDQINMTVSFLLGAKS